MSKLTYIGVAVLVLVVSSAIVAWSFGLNTQPSKPSIAPTSTQPSPSPVVDKFGIINITNDQGKKETLITGFVVSKQNDGLILDAGSPDYTFVELISGEEILRISGGGKTAIVWESVKRGDSVKISSLRVDGTARKIAFLKEEYRKK